MNQSYTDISRTVTSDQNLEMHSTVFTHTPRVSEDGTAPAGMSICTSIWPCVHGRASLVGDALLELLADGTLTWYGSAEVIEAEVVSAAIESIRAIACVISPSAGVLLRPSSAPCPGPPRCAKTRVVDCSGVTSLLFAPPPPPTASVEVIVGPPAAVGRAELGRGPGGGAGTLLVRMTPPERGRC